MGKSAAMEKDGHELLFDGKALRNLIIPLIIEQFLAILVGMADTIMVSSVGETAVSAVSLIDTIMILLINIFTALAMGGAIVAGQALGRRHREDACIASEQTLIISTLFATIIMALVYLFRWPMLQTVFGKIEPQVMRNCNLYLIIVTVSIPFLAIYNSGAAMFRAMGNSKTPMIMSLIMNGINLVGNAILLYGLHWGVEGAAIPTAFSRIFTGIWMLFLMKNPQNEIYVRSLKGLRPNLPVQKKILGVGIPYSMENSMFQLGKILVLSLVSGFGTSAIAANAVCNSLASFAILGGSSMGMALSSVTAQCIGAGDIWQTRYYTRKLLKNSYLAMLVTNGTIILLLHVIVSMFHLTPETAEIVKKIIMYHAVCASTIWPLSFTIPNVLRSANDVKYCMWVAIGSMWIFRIGFSYLIGKYMGWGVFGVWVAMTIDWMVRGAFFIWRYRGEKWYPIRRETV